MGGTGAVAHDPSVAVRRRHLPALARREERDLYIFFQSPDCSKAKAAL